MDMRLHAWHIPAALRLLSQDHLIHQFRPAQDIGSNHHNMQASFHLAIQDIRVFYETVHHFFQDH